MLKSSVMIARPRRSKDVTTATLVSASSAPTSATLDLEALYRGCRDDLFAYAVTMLRDPAAAEDVIAVAFERAVRKQRSYDPRRGTQRAWLFGIARNAALDELRRRSRTAALVTDLEDTEAPSPDDVAERAEHRVALKAALSHLSAREREIVGLKFHAGLSNAELAQVLDVSVSAAGTQVHRVMTKLRKAVQGDA